MKQRTCAGIVTAQLNPRSMGEQWSANGMTAITPPAWQLFHLPRGVNSFAEALYLRQMPQVMIGEPGSEIQDGCGPFDIAASPRPVRWGQAGGKREGGRACRA